jgi:multiple sugar transport system substrate-binding protein
VIERVSTSLTRRRVLGTARIAAAATPVALLGACGTGAGKAPAAAAVSGKVVWSTRVNADENLWQQQAVVPKVKEKLPKVDLTFDTAPSSDWAVKLIASYAAGTPPDIHHGFAGIVISLYAQGQALELSPFIKRDKVDLAPYGGLQYDPDMCRSGKTWELPIDSSLTTMVFYNATMLQQAGLPLPPTSWKDTSWTWDRMLDMAKKTTKNWGEADAVYGLLGATANPWFQLFPYLWGGDLWPKDFYAHGMGQTSQLTTSQVVESLQYIQDLALKQRVMPAQGQPSKAFNVGGGALWITQTTAGATALKDATFAWGMAPMPRQTTNKTVAYTNGIMGTKGTKAPDAAWAVIKYLVSQEGQLDRIKVTPATPTRTDAFDPWLDYIQPKTVHKTKAEVKDVATGGLASYVDAWPHFIADATSLMPSLFADLQASLLSGKATAATLLADTKTQVETQMRAIYEKYKSSPLATDTLCS